MTARQMGRGWEKAACQQAACQHERHKKLRLTIACAHHAAPSPTISVQREYARCSDRVLHRCLPRGFKLLTAHGCVNVSNRCRTIVSSSPLWELHVDSVACFSRRRLRSLHNETRSACSPTMTPSQALLRVRHRNTSEVRK